MLEDYSYANHKKKIIRDSFQKIKAWGISGSYMEFGTFRANQLLVRFMKSRNSLSIDLDKVKVAFRVFMPLILLPALEG